MLDRVVVERHKTYRSYYQIITQDIGASSLEAFWMSISFLLAAVAFQPAHTAMSDIFGRKLVLYVCCLFFVIGLVVFGTAESPTTIIIGRTIQGFGGGGLEALSEVILTDITTLKERPLYLGIMSFFWAGAAVAGPPIGGALAEYTTWRWLAWILLPFIGVALILIHPTLTLRQDRNSIMLKLTRVDWLGLLLSVSAATMVLFAITAGGQIFPWSSVQILTPLLLLRNEDKLANVVSRNPCYSDCDRCNVWGSTPRDCDLVYALLCTLVLRECASPHANRSRCRRVVLWSYRDSLRYPHCFHD